MYTLNQKQFKELAKAIAIAARLNEIERLEGYVPSGITSTRKRALKKQLASLTGGETEEDKIRININLSSGQVTGNDKKSFPLSLKDLLKSKSNKEEDEDDDILLTLQRCLPEGVLGKIVTEL